MRLTPILEDNYYHVYNRGVQKQKLFHDQNDYSRFLFLLLHCQSIRSLDNTRRKIAHFLKHKDFNISVDQIADMVKHRDVEVINFCIMPNHFHLTLANINESGISRYLHQISTSYAKYFNTKYEKTGHVFEGSYKAKLVADDNYLSYLSAYIHKNPSEISKWKGKEELYPWSSFSDYVAENRWSKLLNTNTILDTFNNPEEYLEFVKTSGAKDVNLLDEV